ncbi:hypothetical protein Fot_42385 [Forsythia ovata]|uniref:Uncharacterized protein n=1 Tax=Forsythia ovata TaxID=205694 RepID=A0ABD1RL10_9LAMI
MASHIEFQGGLRWGLRRCIQSPKPEACSFITSRFLLGFVEAKWVGGHVALSRLKHHFGMKRHVMKVCNDGTAVSEFEMTVPSLQQTLGWCDWVLVWAAECYAAPFWVFTY